MLLSLRLAPSVSQARNRPAYRDYRGIWRRRLAQQQPDLYFPGRRPRAMNGSSSPYPAARRSAITIALIAWSRVNSRAAWHETIRAPSPLAAACQW